MTWKTVYENFDTWSPSILSKHLANLTDYGSPRQIMEVADYLDDASLLIRAAMHAGVVFTPNDLLELEAITNQITLEEAIAHSLKNGVFFSHDQILEFDGLVSKSTLTAMVKNAMDRGVRFTEDQLSDFVGLVDDSVLPKFDAEEKLQKNHDRRMQPNDFYVAYALHDMTMEEDRKKKIPTFRVGENVKVGSMDGLVIDKNGAIYTVRCGHRVGHYDASQLEKL